MIAELVGTFFLVFAGTGAIVVDQTYGSVSHVGIALTFGLIVIAMIYAIGEVSGAHINPAVTIGFWIAGRFPARSVVPYLVAQFAGAILASLLLSGLFPDSVAEGGSLGATLPAGSWQQAFVFELMLTMLLMFVILRVSSGSKETGQMAGLAIGATVALEAMFAGPVCGASMNPARSLGPAVVSLKLEHLWIYLVATVAGAALAVAVDWFMREPKLTRMPPE